MRFQFFPEKIEFSKLNLKIEFHEPLNGLWKVLGCNTEYPIRSKLRGVKNGQKKGVVGPKNHFFQKF